MSSAVVASSDDEHEDYCKSCDHGKSFHGSVGSSGVQPEASNSAYSSSVISRTSVMPVKASWIVVSGFIVMPAYIRKFVPVIL